MKTTFLTSHITCLHIPRVYVGACDDTIDVEVSKELNRDDRFLMRSIGATALQRVTPGWVLTIFHIHRQETPCRISLGLIHCSVRNWILSWERWSYPISSSTYLSITFHPFVNAKNLSTSSLCTLMISFNRYAIFYCKTCFRYSN